MTLGIHVPVAKAQNSGFSKRFQLEEGRHILLFWYIYPCIKKTLYLTVSVTGSGYLAFKIVSSCGSTAKSDITTLNPGISKWFAAYLLQRCEWYIEREGHQESSAACCKSSIWLMNEFEETYISCNTIIAKAHVVLSKRQTLPRLELQAGSKTFEIASHVGLEITWSQWVENIRWNQHSREFSRLTQYVLHMRIWVYGCV